MPLCFRPLTRIHWRLTLDALTVTAVVISFRPLTRIHWRLTTKMMLNVAIQ